MNTTETTSTETTALEDMGFKKENIFETFLTAGLFDSKGREVGYIVGMNDNGTDFRAWVQNARSVKGDFSDFGVMQRTKGFASKEAARTWAYATAKERIAKLRAKAANA